jgi:hypothetical protein
VLPGIWPGNTADLCSLWPVRAAAAVDERLNPFAANVLRTVVLGNQSSVEADTSSLKHGNAGNSQLEATADRRPDEVVVVGHDPHALAFLHL